MLKIEIRGDDLVCADTAPGGAETRGPRPSRTIARIAGWAADYDRAVRSGAQDVFAPIGRDIAAFLNEGDRWLDRVLGGGVGDFTFEVQVSGNPNELERQLLDVLS